MTGGRTFAVTYIGMIKTLQNLCSVKTQIVKSIRMLCDSLIFILNKNN